MMLFVVPGLLVLLCARTLARWVVDPDDAFPNGAPSTGDPQIDVSHLWTWGYRTVGLIVIGIGLLAHCLPIDP